ncbi:GATA transcription factor 19-like isoform X2 [Solanum pennellii]|uniref:GATA transcription factor 19-like isoform X2 n=1 Tax=Solanum pennellii TaxID=28526 RepID=A0ABM1GEK2_SOLPN|nr:GATA transcription factor 19-like isoform X2 [Solanum pennellii]
MEAADNSRKMVGGQYEVVAFQQEYVNVPIRVDRYGGGGFEAHDISVGGGYEEAMSSGEELQVCSMPLVAGPVDSGRVMAVSSRTSELTISFEGQVYVFPAVTPEKVQAVMLLLGGCEVPSYVPNSNSVALQSTKSVENDVPTRQNISPRMASLIRFREKRKDRCFEKTIRYACRKEVAQRMHRKNGQFASLKEGGKSSADNIDSGDSAAHSEPTLRRCHHCGTNESETPAMRRGPSGPRTLCNACGLMWANKGMFRDITKGGSHVPFDKNEPGTPDIKLSTFAPENSYLKQHQEGSSGETKLTEENPSVTTAELDMQEAAENFADSSPFRIRSSSVNIDDEDNLDELANASGTEFEIPADFDEQIGIDSHMSVHWPVT